MSEAQPSGHERPEAERRHQNAGQDAPRSIHSVWHDVECGRYTADLALWRELARRADGPILDVGAGAGRVALHLARAGHSVTALDHDPELLAVLEERARAAGLDIETVVADAAAFDVGEDAFALVLVPMQTIQLLPERGGFFASARRALSPGGLAAIAIADALESFEEGAEMPLPDIGEADGWRFVSQPTAVRPVPGGVRIERIRQAIAPGGERTMEDDVVVLADVTVGQVEAEGVAAGLRPAGTRHVEATADHVGAEVVILRG
jgi:SAM-dependent methyltransferase